MKVIIDLLTNGVVGHTTDAAFSPSENQQLIDAPSDFDVADFSDWSFDGTALTKDLAAALARAKAAKKTRIKADAARLIAALDWKLERAKERQLAGWATQDDVIAVLAEREAIRRSSSAAENDVDAMTDSASVMSHSWSVDSALTPST